RQRVRFPEISERVMDDRTDQVDTATHRALTDQVRTQGVTDRRCGRSASRTGQRPGPSSLRGYPHMRRSVRAFVFALALAIPIGSANAQPAAAYGADAVYQIGLSFNCDNKVACALSESNPFGPGGFWGWIELDSATHPGTSGTANIAVTGCSHDTPF